MSLVETITRDHNLWIVTCFAAYILSIVIFGLIYYLLYRRLSTRFMFATEIKNAQIEAYEVHAKRTITWLGAQIEALDKIATTVESFKEIEKLADKRFQAHLPSGTSFKLFSMTVRAPFGGTHTLCMMALYDENDQFLKQMGVPNSIFGTDYAFAKRKRKNKLRIQNFQEKLERVDVDTLDVWSYWDFLYFSSICQTTVGFGDILPNSTQVRLVVVLQILIGYALLAVLLNAVFH